MTEKTKNGGSASGTKGAPDSFKEGYLENVFENSADAIGIMDSHGRAVRWNKAATELFGYSLGELREMRVFDLYPDKERLEKMLIHLRQKGFVRKFEIKVTRKDGRILPFEMSISLLKDEEGNLIGSVGVARDLSDIKRVMAELTRLNRQLQQEIIKSRQMEQELRKARDELENLVRERTAKLSKAGDLLQKSIKRIKDITESEN